MNQHLGYRDARRLADVMALVQVLSLGEDTKRSENGLERDLQRRPMTAGTWTAIAKSHAEFFRVRAEDEGNREAHRVSLVMRAVTPKRELEDKRDPLPSDILGRLLDIAITLHDREVARREQWKSFLPIAAAIIAGFCAVTAALIKAPAQEPSTPSAIIAPKNQ